MSENINNSSIEEQYKSVTDIEHVLLRPGMSLGNMHFESTALNLYKPSTNKMDYIQNVAYNAGLIKLFDEIISNSVDVHIKKDGIFDVTKIDINVNTSGLITVKDNGGIPVVIHKTEKIYLPHMLFGKLRTSGNYNEKRRGAGLNGLGSKLTNIFSLMFKVETCDGNKKFIGTWTENMKNFDEQISNTKQHFTETTFQIDLKRFKIDQLDLATIRIIQKRCIDAAASNPGLEVNFKSNFKDGILNSEWKFESFKEYVKLYTTEDDAKTMLEYKSGNDELILIPRNIGFDFGFVNGSICSNGSHITKIYNQITKKVLSILEQKNIDLITRTDIYNHMSIFCKTQITNPDYDSQAKDKLTNKLAQSTLYLSNKFLDQLEDSELIEQLVDYYNVKYVAEQKKKTRKINRELAKTKSDKLMKCSGRGEKELWIFEGDSAKGGFRHARCPITQAAFLLRGKIPNTLGKNPEDILLNKEFFEIAATLKLQFYEPEKNLKNCEYTKIVICCDMDTDGSHIAGLLFVFFATFFPELIKDGRVYRALSPIIVASKGRQEKLFYNLDDYNANLEQLKGWKILYKKGLGGLKQSHYNEMVKHPTLEQYFLGNDYQKTIRTWFAKSTDMRKEIIAIESGYTTNDAEYED